MKVRELIEMLVQHDMDSEVYLTDATESDFDPYNSVEDGICDVFDIYRRGVYICKQ